MLTKICSKCGIEKSITDFYKDKCQKDGYGTQCKNCKQKYREQHRNQAKQNSETWRLEHPNYNKDYESKRKGTRAEYFKQYEQDNKDKRLEQHRIWYNNNKEKQEQYRKQYYEMNKQTINKNKQIKRQSDVMLRFNSSFSSNLHNSLKFNNVSGHWEDFVPYKLQDLKNHLESQFDENMNWDNYGTYWEVDHIIPQNLFNFSSVEDKEFQICWSLLNLRPLEKIANRQRPKDGRDIPENIKQKIMGSLI